MVEISSGGVAVDNITLKTNDDGQIYADSSEINPDIPGMEIELIELQANSALTPLDHDSLISDTFSDSTGYLNSVNTTNTTASFSSNKYIRNTDSGTDSIGSTYTITNSNSGEYGFLVTAQKNCKLTAVTKSSSATCSTAYLREEDGTLIASAAFSGNVATFDNDLISGTSYRLTSGSGGSSYTFHGTPSPSLSYPISGEYINWVSDYVPRNILSATFQDTPITKIIEIDLPTISGNVKDVQLICRTPEREDGDSVTFDLIDTDLNEDTGIQVGTKTSLTNVDGSKISNGKIKINLSPAATDPTNGTPSIKSYCLKVWKE